MIRSEAPDHVRSKIWIDAKLHYVIDLPTLERLGYSTRGSLTYPPTVPGWATTTVGSHRFAAWYAAKDGRMPEAMR